MISVKSYERKKKPSTEDYLLSINTCWENFTPTDIHPAINVKREPDHLAFLGRIHFEKVHIFLKNELTSISNFISINGVGVGVVPIELRNLAEEIERSKYMLELPDNWDDEGAIGYTVETWIKAIKFLINYSTSILNTTGKTIFIPKIYHGPEGSIDIYWEYERFNLLINITNTGLCTYFGDNYKSNKIHGEFDASDYEFLLFPFLLNYK
ncbi:MAG: hypothetical protein ACO1NU_04355 [Arcticibacter sp.]